MIQQKANGRKLASRWKNTDFEHKLEEYGLKVSVYISLNPERVKKYADTEPASFLQGKRDEYFLIHPDMKENQHDIALYEKLGFINNEDVFWSIHTPTAAQRGAPDEYGNICTNESGGKVFFEGFGASVHIGKGVRLPKEGLYVKKDSQVSIGDYSDISGWSFRGAGANDLIVGNRVNGGSGIIVYFANHAEIKIDDRNHFRSTIHPFIIRMSSYSSLHMKAGNSFGGNCQFWVHYQAAMEIGEGCLYSDDITMIAGDGHSIFDTEMGSRLNPVGVSSRNDICVGNHCWVAYGTIILASVLKDSSIVGAGSLVKGRFTNNVVIAGTPAKVIRTNVTWNYNALEKNVDLINPKYVKASEIAEEPQAQIQMVEKENQERINALKETVEELQNQVDDLKQMESSFSWRITAPLRKFRYWQLCRKNRKKE